MVYNTGMEQKIISELDTLQINVWNAYYDAYGCRPRYWTSEEWANVAFLTKMLKQAENVIIASLIEEN